MVKAAAMEAAAAKAEEAAAAVRRRRRRGGDLDSVASKLVGRVRVRVRVGGCEARAPGLLVGCAELVSVERWRVDDALTLSSTQTVVRNLSRPLILVSVFWRERLARSLHAIGCRAVADRQKYFWSILLAGDKR